MWLKKCGTKIENNLVKKIVEKDEMKDEAKNDFYALFFSTIIVIIYQRFHIMYQINGGNNPMNRDPYDQNGIVMAP